MKWYKSSRQTCCFAWHVTFNYSLLMMPYKGWMFKNWDKQIPNCYQWTVVSLQYGSRFEPHGERGCLRAVWMFSLCQTGVDVRGCGCLCLCVSPLMGHVLGVPWLYPYNTWGISLFPVYLCLVKPKILWRWQLSANGHGPDFSLRNNRFKGNEVAS